MVDSWPTKSYLADVGQKLAAWQLLSTHSTLVAISQLRATWQLLSTHSTLVAISQLRANKVVESKDLIDTK